MELISLSTSGKIITGHNGPQFLLDGKRFLRIMCAYSPLAVYGRFEEKAVDTSLTGCNNEYAGNKDSNLVVTRQLLVRRDARLLQGTKAVRRMDIRAAIAASGGIRILLPLFQHLHQPLILQMMSVMILDETESPTVDPTFTMQVFSLLEMLLQDMVNQDQMIATDGFQMIGYLLERVNPQCLTKETVSHLEKLSVVVSTCEPLFRQLFLHIFLNFRILIYAELTTQKEVLAIVARHVKKQPQYFRSLITIQSLMDVLRKFYWFTPEENISQAKEPIVNRQSMDVLGRRPEYSGVKQLRVMLLQIVKLLAVDGGFSLDETQALLLYLLHCQDAEQGIDVLQLLLAILSIPAAAKRAKNNIADHLFELGGLVPFISLLKRGNLLVRVCSLKIIGKLLQLSQSKRKERLLSSNRLLSIKQYLEPFIFNDSTYYSLMEVMLERVSDRAVKNPLSDQEDTDFVIKNPEMLSIVFELLCTSGQTALQERVLQDFVFLLNHSPVNRDAFLSQSHWQNWLFGILANNNSNDGNRDVFQKVVRILTMLFQHSLNQPNGWKQFFDTQTLLGHFGEMGFFSSLELTRELNIAMLRGITYDTKIIEKGRKVPAVWENLIQWLFFSEQCLFVLNSGPGAVIGVPTDDHFLLGIHRRPDGMWLDFEFAQKLLDFLDSLVLSPSGAAADSSIPSLGQSSKNASEDSLMRLILRLTLYTLYETDAFLNTEKIRERSAHLKTVEASVESFFAEELANSRLGESLSHYLQGKIRQWNAEMSSVDKVFQKNIERLRQVVRRLLNMDGSINRIMYIISFLYKAMKRSYEHQGIGAELILTVFKEILLSCRSHLPSTPEISAMSEDQFV